MAIKPSPFREIGGDVLVTITADKESLDAGETLMLEIAGEVENLATPMLAARHIAMEDMQKRFDTETTPEGDPWVQLDPDYWRSKQSLGFPDKILQREQDLMHAATSQDAWLITENTIFFNPLVLPFYGIYHQEGLGQQENWGLRADYVSRAESGGVSSYSHTSMGIGRGNALPARPFIGMSEEAEAKIWAVFDSWFETAGEPGAGLYIRPSGVTQRRSPSGRFGSKVV